MKSSHLTLFVVLSLLGSTPSQANSRAKASDFVAECTSECGGPDWYAYEVCAEKPQQHAKLPALQAQSTYHIYRQQLLKAGWKALRVKPKPVDPKDPDVWNGAEFWKAGYKELESCAGTGVAPCAFRFMDKQGNHLRVITRGEEDPATKRYASVHDTQFVCFE